jgi:hypothetical protein
LRGRSLEKNENFNYNEETLLCTKPPRCISQTELEMTARFINQPGAVQAFGCFLLVQQGMSMRVVACASNTDVFLGMEATQVLGQDVSTLFEERAAVKRAIESPNDTGIRTMVATPKNPAGELAEKVNLIIMQSLQGISIDIEPYGTAVACPADEEGQVNESIQRINTCESKETMFEQVVQEIKELAGYERVMLYMFHEDYHGEVMAEARVDGDTRSYLHMHFPATDIPQRARDLFLLNKVRIIVDSSTQPSKLVCLNDTNITPQSISLSTSTTRAVHPSHLEYLQNWGVLATLVMSIRINGKLWGLVCCNHESSTRYLNYSARIACANVVDAFAARLSQVLTQENQAHLARFEASANTLFAHAGEGRNFDLKKLSSCEDTSLLDIIKDTHGAAIVSKDGSMQTIGQVPSDSQLLALARWRLSEAGCGMPAVGCLAKVYPETVDPNVCGMLSMPLLSGGVVMWFRSEIELDIKWTGNPNECKTRIPGSSFLPVNSFQTFVQTVKGNCLPWGSKNVTLAAEFADKLDKTWADASSNCIFAVDSGGRITRFNDAMALAIGTPKKEAIGTLLAKICPMHGDNVIERLERISVNGPHDVYISFRADAGLSRSHKTVELLGCVQPLRDATGNRLSLFIGKKVNEGDPRDPLAARLQDVRSDGLEKHQDPRSLLPSLAQDPLEIPHQLNVLHKVFICMLCMFLCGVCERGICTGASFVCRLMWMSSHHMSVCMHAYQSFYSHVVLFMYTS